MCSVEQFRPPSLPFQSGFSLFDQPESLLLLLFSCLMYRLLYLQCGFNSLLVLLHSLHWSENERHVHQEPLHSSKQRSQQIGYDCSKKCCCYIAFRVACSPLACLKMSCIPGAIACEGTEPMRVHCPTQKTVAELFPPKKTAVSKERFLLTQPLVDGAPDTALAFRAHQLGLCPSCQFLCFSPFHQSDPSTNTFVVEYLLQPPQ